MRYWITEIVDGQPKRVHRSQRLCFKDDKHYAVNAKAVKLLRDAAMLKINQQSQQGRTNEPAQPKDMKIADFWEQVFVPYIEANKKSATVQFYKKYWQYYLKDHFGQTTLREYLVSDASNLLTKISSQYSASTLSHIRALGSAVFGYAIGHGYPDRKHPLSVNPWRNAKNDGKPKKIEGTQHYTLQEIQDVIHALGHCTVNHKQKQAVPHAAEMHEHQDAQLLMALTFFCGLRPSEAIGLDWSDINDGFISIERAVVNGVIDDTKTDEARASVPLIEPALSLLIAWHQNCESPSKGWVFSGKHSGKPLNIPNLVNRVIRPTLEEAGLTWKGLYAGRRGVGTMLVDLTKGLVAAQELLRHKNMNTTAKFYKKRTQNALASGMKLLEAAASNGNGKKADEQQ